MPPEQLDLMPEEVPSLNPELGQFFTLPRLADRIACEFPIRGRVIEPTAGNGNLVDAIGARHWGHATVTAVELDPRWVRRLRRRFEHVPEDVQVLEGDVLRMELRSFDWWVGNPPDASDYGIGVADFLEQALDLAPEAVALVRTNALHCVERHKRVWSGAHVRRTVHLVQRPRFVGPGGQQEWSVVWFGREPGPVLGTTWWEGSWS